MSLNVIINLLIAFLFIAIHPFSIFPVVIHEYGHYIHLKLSCKFLHIHCDKFICKFKPKEICIARIYNGKLFNSSYKYLEQNHHYFILKQNAIAGSIFFCFMCYIVSVVLCFLKVSSIVLIGLEIANFIKSSDFTYFLNPKSFKYIDNYDSWDKN